MPSNLLVYVGLGISVLLVIWKIKLILKLAVVALVIAVVAGYNTATAPDPNDPSKTAIYAWVSDHTTAIGVGVAVVAILCVAVLPRLRKKRKKS